MGSNRERKEIRREQVPGLSWVYQEREEEKEQSVQKAHIYIGSAVTDVLQARWDFTFLNPSLFSPIELW